MFLEPTKIVSPYSGQAVFPTISSHVHDGKRIEQAVYTDPVTGHLIKKGLVSIKDEKSGELLADYKNQVNNSLKNFSYRP